MTTFMIFLSLGMMALSVFFYYNVGTYVYVGNYNGWPLYWYFPFLPSIVFSILAFFISVALIFLSLRPKESVFKLSILVTFLFILLSLLVARFTFGFTPEKIMLELPSPTDAQLIQLLAARSLLEGHNPYTQDYEPQMLSSLAPQQYTWIFKQGTSNYTPSTIVGFVHSFDYLPSAALYYLPAVAFGIPANVYNAGILALGSALIFHKLKGKNKILFSLLASSFMFMYFAPLLLYRNTPGWIVPFVMAILFPENPLLSGIMLAWASTYRLYVLIFTIFYLILIWKEGYDVKSVVKYGLITAVVLDLPFILLNPKAFWRDNLLPFVANFRPYDGGPGLISLTYLGIEVTKTWSFVGLIMIIVIGLILSLRYYNTLRYGILAFPLISFFFYYRPLPSYYIYFLPLIFLVYVFIVERGELSLDLSESALTRISAYSVVLGLLSIVYMYGVYTFGVISNIQTAFALFALFIVTPFMIYFRNLVFKISPYLLFLIILSLSTLVLLFIPSELHGTNFIVMGHGYIGDAMLLPDLASQSIINGVNPYICNYSQVMNSLPYFGSLYEIFHYSNDVINISQLHASKVFTPYYTPNGTYYYHGLPTENITFYDYPPMNAIFLVPAHLFNIPIRLWELLVYIIIISLIFLKFMRRGDWEKALALTLILMSGYFVSSYGFVFLMDSTSWIVLIILGLTFYESPLIFGLLTGMAVDSMPQAIILFPYLLIYLNTKFGGNYVKRFLTTSIVISILLLLPFVITYPKSLYLMLFPVLAKLPMVGIGIVTIIGIFVFHTIWPLTLFKPIPYITLALTLIITYLFRKRLEEVSLMIPIYVILTFTRSYPEYLIYYPYIAFLVWLTTEEVTSKYKIEVE